MVLLEVPPNVHTHPSASTPMKGAKLGDLPALLELCSLLASSGREKEALEHFYSSGSDDQASGTAVSTAAGQGSLASRGGAGFGALLAASALTPVHLLLRLGELQAARQLLADLLPSAQSQQLDSPGSGGGAAGQVMERDPPTSRINLAFALDLERLRERSGVVT